MSADIIVEHCDKPQNMAIFVSQLATKGGARKNIIDIEKAFIDKINHIIYKIDAFCEQSKSGLVCNFPNFGKTNTIETNEIIEILGLKFLLNISYSDFSLKKFPIVTLALPFSDYGVKFGNAKLFTCTGKFNCISSYSELIKNDHRSKDLIKSGAIQITLPELHYFLNRKNCEFIGDSHRYFKLPYDFSKEHENRKCFFAIICSFYETFYFSKFDFFGNPKDDAASFFEPLKNINWHRDNAYLQVADYYDMPTR